MLPGAHQIHWSFVAQIEATPQESIHRKQVEETIKSKNFSFFSFLNILRN
jgi:hypothetical protein